MITTENFKDFKKALYTVLHEEPAICEIICSNLQILIQQSKGTIEGKIDLHGLDTSTSR